MSLLIANRFRYYTPFRPTGSTDAALHPVTNLSLLLHPLRTWRSATTGAQAVILDLQSVDTVKAVLLVDCNFPYVSMGVSDDRTFTTFQGRFTAAAVPTLELVNRRRVWLHDPNNPYGRRYVRITAMGTPDNGAGYFEIGIVAVVTSWVDMGIGVEAVASNRFQSIGRLDYRDRGADVRSHGRPGLEVGFERSEGWTPSELAKLWPVIDVGRGRPLAVWDNRDGAEKFYLGRRTSAPEFSERLTLGTMPLVLREAA